MYDYGKNAAMGKMKNSRKGKKMIRVIDKVARSVPHHKLEYYRNIHIDTDIMFVNNIPLNLKFIHCRVVLSRRHKRLQGNVVTVSGDIEFGLLKEWMKEELNVVLDTCDRDGHVPTIEIAMHWKWYAFSKATQEMVRRAVIFINWCLQGKSYMEKVPNSIKFGEYMLAYNIESGKKSNI